MPNLVAGRAASATAAHALDRMFFLQLVLGYTADACGVEIRLFGLDTAKAAQLKK
jgi:hypothetical protein